MLTKITPAMKSNPQLVNFLVVEGMGQDKEFLAEVLLAPKTLNRVAHG
jgi:hypothetical protein